MAQVVKRGQGRWMVRVFLGRGDDGKRRYHNKTIHGTKKNADQYARKIQTAVDKDEFVESVQSPETVAEFLDRWLDNTATRKVAKYTLDDYRAQCERYLKPVMGTVQLSKLAVSDVERLVAWMEAKGLASRTIRYAQGVLRNALNKAMREKTILSNPASAELIDLPKIQKRELTVLDGEQARAFLTAASEDRWAALWTVLLGSGARPGEVLALRWEDFDGKAIRIQRALVRDRSGGGWSFRPPKTKTSRRTVPLPTSAIASLKTHRRAQVEEKLAATEYTDHELIFSDASGEPLSWDRIVRRHFDDILTQADVPKIRPYDLRHTCASLLLAAGVNPKIVSERLGHSTITLTLDTYSAVLPGLQEVATEKLDSVFGG
jgi:integrase